MQLTALSGLSLFPAAAAEAPAAVVEDAAAVAARDVVTLSAAAQRILDSDGLALTIGADEPESERILAQQRGGVAAAGSAATRAARMAALFSG